MTIHAGMFCGVYMQIAIIDDDPIARQILRSSINRLGMDVIEFPDGSAAWDYFLANPPRFVITDWLMPTLDGLDLIRNIRSARFHGYTYSIILTGKEDKTDVIAGLSAGADDYLTKPFDIAELRARINIGIRILDLEDDLNRAREQMERMAMYDYLTGLLSRRAIYTHMQGEMERIHREGGSMSIMMLDLDHFKALNDSYGHMIGDQALCLVAEQITQSVRPYDWAARWGGDEFLVVLPNTSTEQAEAVSKRILARIRKLTITVPEKEPLHLCTSIGVVSTTEINNGIDGLIQIADEALYSAKNGGKDCIVIRNMQSLGK
jgi:two-component system cell cycle response regulator